MAANLAASASFLLFCSMIYNVSSSIFFSKYQSAGQRIDTGVLPTAGIKPAGSLLLYLFRGRINTMFCGIGMRGSHRYFVFIL